MTSKQDQNKASIWSNDVVKRLLACLAAGIASALLWIIPFTGEHLYKMARMVDDYFVRNDHGLQPREDIVFLGIDADSMQLDSISEETIQKHPSLAKMSSAWPWDRSVHAAMIDRLADAGAKLIVIDLIFGQPSTPEGDQALADAIARHRDKVVLASAFIPGEDGGQMRIVEPLDAFLGPLENETASGFVNFWPHARDGIVRRAHLTKTLSAANGMDEHPDEPVFQSLAAVAAEKLGQSLPDNYQRFRMARLEKKNVDRVYQARSYYTVFVPEIWESRYKGGAFFKDKIVFVGPASPLFQDSHETPAGRVLGAQLHMHVLTALLEDAWYKEYDIERPVYLAFLILLGFLASSFVCFRWSRTWILGAAVIGGVLVYVFVERVMVHSAYQFVGSMASVSTFSLGLLGAIIWQAMSERAQRQQLHRHLRRSMSPDVADAIVRAPEGYYKAAEGNRRMVTVLFTDIRGFTHRSEEQDAGELVSQLNTYFERMVEVIFSHGGTVDKFIGDAIMATWGSLGETDPKEQTNQAAAAAEEMLDVLGELNATWEAQGLQPFRIGIGIHHGEAIVGEVGSDQRTDFTVIGDAVNLASRIEGLTKVFGVDLLVSDSVVGILADGERWVEVAKVRVKGRDKGVSLSMPGSTVADENTLVRDLVQQYASGNWLGTRKLLDGMQNPTYFSGVIAFYQQQLESEPELPQDWDGVITMRTK